MKNLIRHILKEETNRFELVKNLIYTIFDEVTFIEYVTKRNEIIVYYQGSSDLAPYEICNTISKYTGLYVAPWYEYGTKNNNEPDFYIDTEKYEEELNENYSPAGKEVTPNNIVVHKSNPRFRDNIMSEGLKAKAGECYRIYAGYGEKCIPAIFATNSTNKRAWFDSTYDDDIWEIDTTMIPDVKWFKDRHYDSRSKHIVTFQDIPKEAITLKHEGTGKDWGYINEVFGLENPDEVEKNLKVINLLLSQASWDGLCDIWVVYNEDELLYEIRSKTTTSYFGDDEIKKELDYLENTLMSMGIRTYIYIPYYVENCKDEVKFMNESKEDTNYMEILKDIVEPFKEDDGVCDIDMWYDDEDGRYSVYLIFGTEELNDKFTNDGKYFYIRKKIMAVKETIKSYLPIDNLFVGSYGKPNCGWKSLNESKEKSTKELIMFVLNTLVLPQYEHVICEFEYKDTKERFDVTGKQVFNYPSVIVTFIGGYGTKMWPQTQAVQKMYDDVLDDIWQTVWDYTGISVELYSKKVKDCGKENIYLREQEEETYDMSPLERTVADFVNMSLSEYELPEAFYKVAVDVFDDRYGREECTITSLFEKPFKLDDSDKMHLIMGKIKRDVNDYFGNVFSHIAFGSSTVDNYNDTRDWYTKRKNKKLNESENKKKSLLKNISDVGLYDFIRMAGIELIDLQTQVGQIPREMLEQFIKDYVSNEGHQYSSSKPDEKIVSIDVRVGGNSIIDFMYYDGKLLSFEVTEYGNGFSKEETDQYIEGAKNYGYDTIFNIANKISRKIN